MLRYAIGALAGALAATSAAAQTPPSPPPVAPAPAPVELAVPATTPTPMSLAELDEQHGRQGVHVQASTNQNLVATNRNNSITADLVDSGDISISEGAFAGFSGVGNFVVNSGHNNNLQGSLSITIVTQ